jgi:endonuclease YncB( thermonuclease family)
MFTCQAVRNRKTARASQFAMPLPRECDDARKPRARRAPRLVVLGMVIMALPFDALTEPIAPSRITVLDGDTIRVDGRRPGIRLLGFNAPETIIAQCEPERVLGYTAMRRLRQLIASGNLDLQHVRCACPAGTERTPSCNYGRTCAVLKARGEDVAAILIREGLAVAFHCSGTGCPPTPRPWCGS